MKRSKIALLGAIVLVAALLGCNSKANGVPTADQAKTVNEEAQKVAEQYADLVISKCGNGYVYKGRGSYSYQKPFAIKVERIEISPTEHFYGYQWRGAIIIEPQGAGSTLQNQLDHTNWSQAEAIYKRSGKWFIHVPDLKEKAEILIDDLQPIRPPCPAAS